MKDEIPNINPSVKVGDKIRRIIRLEGGGHIVGSVVVVKSFDSHGTPYVRYRFGKVDKPALEYVAAETSPNQ